MIINPEILDKVYICKEKVMRYLLYECHIPILGYDDYFYYFTKNDELEARLKKMPLNLKIISLFSKYDKRERR